MNFTVGILPRLCLAALGALAAGLLAPDSKADGAAMAAEDFLAAARTPPGRESWAMMEGTASHRRRGAATRHSPIYLGVRFTPARTLAQIVVDENESYIVGQSYEGGAGSASLIANLPEDRQPVLGEFGLHPRDLAMSFLYWDLLEELPTASFKGRPCRVFMLADPDGGGRVEVTISSEHLFPLRARWFGADEREPSRVLEVGSFRKRDDFWLVSSLTVHGPGWRTSVDFDDTRAGFADESIPPRLFKTNIGTGENQ